ncbi:trypsin-like serine protease [Pontibacter litorisediminis]|uniref:trypsin-like serine protease n=1 Tax=Pontibacter litorisediminis TaxID=1846260 RepID=UPI0023EB60A3|nr:trypsin-like serine protease [Pontibacter litorisediminis]
MPRRIQQCCARTSIKISDDEYANQGSGVIVLDSGCFFLITAHHCVFGEDNEYCDITVDNICVEIQNGYTSEFSRVKVLEIVKFCDNNDWVLLKIEDPCIEDCSFLEIYRGKNFVEEEQVHFCGYQNKNPNEYRPWKAKVLTISKSKDQFKITLEDKTFDQGGEEGVLLAKGLSGSGVFILRGKELYLIGILKSVVGDKALNDDLDCCSITNLLDSLTDDYKNLSDLNLLEQYVKEVDQAKSEEDVERWSENNVEDFENLIRKHRVLYSEKKAVEFTSDRILEFLCQNAILDNIRKDNGDLLAKYERTAVTFEKRVKQAYTRNVTDRDLAKDLLGKLESDFALFIKDIFKDDSNYLNTELARHKVTEWLMNCSFDFQEEE